MLNVARLSKCYGRNMAIDEISFQIRQGEIVGLVGHNGCGKSTTMENYFRLSECDVRNGAD